MANQRGLAAPLGVEFAPPHRADRIADLLAAPVSWTPADMAVVHMDTHVASAAPLLDLLAGLDGLGPAADKLRDRLLAWDRRMAADSVDAARYAALRSAVVRRFAAEPALAGLAGPSPYPEPFLPWLALLPRVAFALETLLADDRLPGVDRAELVRAAVEEAAGADSGETWGATHRLAPWQALPGADGGPEVVDDVGPERAQLSTTLRPPTLDESQRRVRRERCERRSDRCRVADTGNHDEHDEGQTGAHGVELLWPDARKTGLGERVCHGPRDRLRATPGRPAGARPNQEQADSNQSAEQCARHVPDSCASSSVRSAPTPANRS